MDCVFVVILFLGVLEGIIGDPCTKSSFLPNLARRQTSTLLEYGQTALCDRYLVSRWYKADRSDMPTKPPQMWTCGTDNPIWLADPLPPNDSAEHVLKACIRGLFGRCFQEIKIKVKNCGKYNVYYLKGTKACNQAYCFNTRKTKNAPNITVSSVVAEYSSLKWETYNKKVYMPHLTYKCTFKGDRDKKYCYQVDWYVDGTIVFENQVVKTEFAEISDSKFTNKGVYNLNTLIQCYVAVKFCGEDEIGEFTVSKGYFIGIKVTTPEIKIERQGKGVVKFKTTVPFACSYMEGKRSMKCKTNVQMMNPSQTECGGERITGSNRCTTVIEGYDSSGMKKYYSNGSWKKEYTMGIVHQDTMDYSSAGLRFIIRLESIGATGNMLVWENRADLPDIFVDVYEKKKSGIWKGKHCHGTGDPHMKNFDGRGFELQMDGEFIMYRNSKVKQEVQIKTTACFNNKVFCTCGVAARAGQDVFVINVCTGQKYANFFECGDGALTVYKLTEKKFEVIFPSGTTMKITLRIWPGTALLDVHIYPFVNDVEKTSGLCGNLDGSNDQLDMQLRDKPTSFDINSYPNNFLNSWRPTANENLFSLKEKVYKNLESLSTSKIKLCICDLNSKSRLTDGPVETSDITCRSETYAECNIVKKKMQCHVRITAKRRRRDLRNHIRRFKRQSSDLGDNSLPITLTEQEARLKCETAMNKSTMYTMCMDKVVDLDQSFLQECILDLKYTGQSEYINNALESALDSCKTITGKNVTLQKTSPEIAEEIMTSICPNNCSGNGDCYNGTCTCNENFGGLDCSFDKYVVPIVDSLSDNGKCDRSDGTCEVITFYGNNFLEDMSTTCNIQRVEIDTSGNPSSYDSFTVAGEQISLFEANCPLDTVPNSFATKFKVSISNNGSVFTPEFDVHIYDSMCQEYDASRDTYLLKDGFCYIQGQCYKNGQVNPNQKCLNCNITDKGNFVWSRRSDFCLIEKQCYKDGEINPINTCDICDTHDKGTTVWSKNRNVCNISGVCFKNGEVNPKNKCQLCNITDSGKNKWSPDNSACIIDRKCYQNGNIANDNPCFACDTKRNKTAWSIRDGFCYIDGLCLMDGQNNPMKPCLICNASDKSSASWSHDTGFCFINDTCYVNYQVDPDDICRICYVSNTEFKTDWSLSRACDNSYRDEETDTTTEMEITTKTTDLPTTLNTDSPTTTLQSTVTSTITKQQLTTEASTSTKTRLTPTTESSTSTTTPTTEESTTKAPSSSAKPRTEASTQTTPTTIISSSTTSQATSTAKSQIKTTSHQNEISWTTSSSVKSFSTTYKTHTESAPIPETAEHTTSTIITTIVPIIVAVFILVLIAIVAILVKRRRNITGGVTLKRLEMLDDGKVEAVYNPMYDKNKMEIDISETKDTEMTKNETSAEVLMSGASADVSESETITPTNQL